MKVTIEVDCTPEEARRFMGLPDVSQLNDSMLQQMKKAMETANPFLDTEALFKAWMPMGGEAMEQFQKAFWKAGTSSSGNDDTSNS